jgi:hypothetical protein
VYRQKLFEVFERCLAQVTVSTTGRPALLKQQLSALAAH